MRPNIRALLISKTFWLAFIPLLTTILGGLAVERYKPFVSTETAQPNVIKSIPDSPAVERVSALDYLGKIKRTGPAPWSPDEVKQPRPEIEARFWRITLTPDRQISLARVYVANAFNTNPDTPTLLFELLVQGKWEGQHVFVGTTKDARYRSTYNSDDVRILFASDQKSASFYYQSIGVEGRGRLFLCDTFSSIKAMEKCSAQ